MPTALTPATIRSPFGVYSHGMLISEGYRLILTSGQLGIAADDTVPDDVEAQAELCFANIAAVLAEGGMTLADIVKINAYVTDRAYMRGYLCVRDRLVADPPPASTLMVVSGFSRPEFKLEVEVTAAKKV